MYVALNGADVVLKVAVVSTTQVRYDRHNLGIAVREYAKILRHAVALAAMGDERCVVFRREFIDFVSELENGVDMFFGMDFDPQTFRVLQHVLRLRVGLPLPWIHNYPHI